MKVFIDNKLLEVEKTQESNSFEFKNEKNEITNESLDYDPPKLKIGKISSQHEFSIEFEEDMEPLTISYGEVF